MAIIHETNQRIISLTSVPVRYQPSFFWYNTTCRCGKKADLTFYVSSRLDLGQVEVVVVVVVVVVDVVDVVVTASSEA